MKDFILEENTKVPPRQIIMGVFAVALGMSLRIK